MDHIQPGFEEGFPEVPDPQEVETGSPPEYLHLDSCFS
jgi:hypothetical protein